jgi:hypothetical protein
MPGSLGVTETDLLLPHVVLPEHDALKMGWREDGIHADVEISFSHQHIVPPLSLSTLDSIRDVRSVRSWAGSDQRLLQHLGGFQLYVNGVRGVRWLAHTPRLELRDSRGNALEVCILAPKAAVDSRAFLRRQLQDDLRTYLRWFDCNLQELAWVCHKLESPHRYLWPNNPAVQIPSETSHMLSDVWARTLAWLSDGGRHRRTQDDAAVLNAAEPSPAPQDEGSKTKLIRGQKQLQRALGHESGHILQKVDEIVQALDQLKTAPIPVVPTHHRPCLKTHAT